MAWQFIDPQLDARVVVGDRVAFTGPEAHHAAVVTRLRPGERVRLVDGAGLAVIGPLTSVDRSRVELEVERVEREPEPVFGVALAQALAKGDRDQLAIQAATELGAVEVVPWQGRRSVSKWTDAKVERGREKWRGIVREAAKQSLRARVPEVGPFGAAAALAEAHTVRTPVVVLDPDAELTLVEALAPGGPLDEAERLTLVVGPEGGIAPEEFAVFDAAGCLRVRLGAEVLRTSTAGPAAIAVVQALRGDWRAPRVGSSA